jgi:hypothetical protein
VVVQLLELEVVELEEMDKLAKDLLLLELEETL